MTAQMTSMTVLVTLAHKDDESSKRARENLCVVRYSRALSSGRRPGGRQAAAEPTLRFPGVCAKVQLVLVLVVAAVGLQKQHTFAQLATTAAI